MKRMIQILPLLAVVIIWCSAAWPQTTTQPPGRQQLVAAGSGVNLGITQLLAEAFVKHHPQIACDVPGSIGTKGAIRATADGAITFGLISRPLEKEEKALGLIAKPYARVPIVVATHPSVTDDGITHQELIEVYQGKRTRWQDGNQIIVLSRERWDSGFQVLQAKIPGFKAAYEESHQAKRWTIHFTDQEANQALAKTPYAIGVSDLGMIKTEHLNLKVLKLNGLMASPENLLNGSYLLDRELSFVYREKNLDERASLFFDFVGSDEGRKILTANGYLPVN
jgi:phosphate transport system substrate-binding protein